jgi:hypothetical protein
LKELEESQTLVSYGITEGSILYLTDKNTEKIFAQILGGAKFEFNVSLAHEPLLSLHQQLDKTYGIPLGILPLISINNRLT